MSEFCHCGKPIVRHDLSEHEWTRGLCRHCDEVRCDAFPGACRPVPPCDEDSREREEGVP